MRVFLVETSKEPHETLHALLQQHNYTVLTFDDVSEAWLAYEKMPPDLVLLTDVGEESLALCRRIREAEKEKNTLLVALIDAETSGYLQAIRDADLDDCVLNTESFEYLEARLALIEERAQIRLRNRLTENAVRQLNEELEQRVIERTVQLEETNQNLQEEITERVQTETALRESEARTRAILETTVDGIITIDERGHIESFNSAAEKIFGYTAAEVMGKNIRILMPSPYQEEHDTYLRNYLETGHRKIIGIGRDALGKHKNGSVFPIDLSVSEVKIGARRTFTGIVRDISERRHLRQEILRISELERRRIGQDLHDGLGQMLTGIGLISQNLARTLDSQNLTGADEVAEVTELIKEADQQARTLARGLIPVDLEAQGLSSALQRLAHNAERLFGIRCSFEEAGSVLVHDNTVATHLYRIAQEALSNAVKHGKARHVKISLAANKEQVRLRIHDDGRGFPKELNEEERGMGVSIMHYRARIIGGTLEIASEIGGGTTITCTLQRLDEPIYKGSPANSSTTK